MLPVLSYAVAMTSKRDDIIYNWEDRFLYNQRSRLFQSPEQAQQLLDWLNTNFCPEVPARLTLGSVTNGDSRYHRDGSAEIELNVFIHFNPETLCHEFAHHIIWTGGDEKLSERYLHGINWLTFYMCLLVHVCGYHVDYIVETANASMLTYDESTLRRTVERWKK